MAKNKPAKRNVTNTIVKKIEVPGKAIKISGVLGSFVECPTCKRQIKKGIMYEHTDKNIYCTKNCIPKPEIVV